MELQHHGILGQKWGKKNGPPYPLSRTGDWSAAERRQHKRNYKDLKRTYKKKGLYKGTPTKFLKDVETKDGDMIKDLKKTYSDAYNKQSLYAFELGVGAKKPTTKNINTLKTLNKQSTDAFKDLSKESFRLAEEALGRYSDIKLKGKRGLSLAQIGQMYIINSDNTWPEKGKKGVFEK